MKRFYYTAAMKQADHIVILDFGGQYAHLIASRIRRLNVLAIIQNPDEISIQDLAKPEVKGIILSGGPQSVYDSESPQTDPEIFNLGKPVLGICYGHQFVCHSLGGKVESGHTKEYGRSEVKVNTQCPLFEGIPAESVFWMSHGDEVTKLPQGFESVGGTPDCTNAAVWDRTKNVFGIQFHPEVTHSQFGTQVLENFVKITEAKHSWTMERFLEEHTKKLQDQIGDRKVLLFVSGGVDSTVAFALLSKILGADRVKGLYIDTGLMRQDETHFVETSLRAIGADLTVMYEADRFIGNLKGVYEPEAKREIIGNAFVAVQREYFAHHKLGEGWVLAQGTIYPDTIETGATKHASKIKTHHNRVPEIQKMIDEGKVIEPIADLYKDEVRALGEVLGLPHNLVWRHPFPGPGLGVRILCSEPEGEWDLKMKFEKNYTYSVLPIKSVGVQGDFRTYRHPALIRQSENLSIEELEKISTRIINQDAEVNRCILPLLFQKKEPIKNVAVHKTTVTPERVAILQRADHCVTEGLRTHNLFGKVWQFPVVLVPISFDGVGKESVILRPIESIDAMSASVGKLPWEFLDEIAKEILKDEVISAVFLDITTKPPGTIEWE